MAGSAVVLYSRWHSTSAKEQTLAITAQGLIVGSLTMLLRGLMREKVYMRVCMSVCSFTDTYLTRLVGKIKLLIPFEVSPSRRVMETRIAL